MRMRVQTLACNIGPWWNIPFSLTTYFMMIVAMSHLDANEVISKFIIRFSMRFYPLADMIIASGCHTKLLVICVKLNHEMEDVESIFLAWFWDMDAAEVSFMRETQLLVPLFPDLQVATPNAEALESII